MHLVADLGNTHVKIAFFRNNILQNQYRWLHTEAITRLEEVIKSIPETKSAIISSVIKPHDEFSLHLKAKYPTIELSHHTKIPIKNKYQTPETLGKDRLCNVVGAFSEFPNENTLCIDFGTCIKYDFINENNEYLGGAIAPGLQMRYKSLHENTGRLPHVNKSNKTPLVGSNTQNSIFSGVLNGIFFEVNGAISSYMEQFGKINIVLTGGDHIHFVESIKNDTFARPNLTLYGLFEILEFNESK